jgi:hypothetical protein
MPYMLPLCDGENFMTVRITFNVVGPFQFKLSDIHVKQNMGNVTYI